MSQNNSSSIFTTSFTFQDKPVWSCCYDDDYCYTGSNFDMTATYITGMKNSNINLVYNLDDPLKNVAEGTVETLRDLLDESDIIVLSFYEPHENLLSLENSKKGELTLSKAELLDPVYKQQVTGVVENFLNAKKAFGEHIQKHMPPLKPLPVFLIQDC